MLFLILFTVSRFLSSLVAFQNKPRTVDRVIDGDTFVWGGEKIRLIGVDCPETSINPPDPFHPQFQT
jgi:endonuclease YncB( thermonuclease family)